MSYFNVTRAGNRRTLLFADVKQSVTRGYIPRTAGQYSKRILRSNMDFVALASASYIVFHNIFKLKEKKNSASNGCVH